MSKASPGWGGRSTQLPEDTDRIQEVICRLRPDVIVETGVAHGGSLIFYASLFEAMGHGRAIGVDIDIREHNRTAIEAHPLATRITLISGSSTARGTLAAVRHGIAPGWSFLVVLDSNHCSAHVGAELDLYAPLVSPGSYIVACDGIMAELAGAPRSAPDWTWNNPVTAVESFERAIRILCSGTQLPIQRGRRAQSGHLLAEELPQAALSRIAAV